MKHKRCKHGVNCRKHHPEPEPEQDLSAAFIGIVAQTSADKKGNDIAFVKLLTEAADKQSDQGDRQAFLFLGPASSDGFKLSGSTVMSAGLPLVRGDQLADLALRSGPSGFSIRGGFLAEVASGRGEGVFRRYLEGLIAALHGEASTRETALHSLSHDRSCRSAWSGLAMHGQLNRLIVRVLEALVETSAKSSSSRRFARAALQSIMLSSITLPPSTTVHELVSGAPDQRELRGQLVCALLSVWKVAPLARRRIHFLLIALCRAHRDEAASLLGLEQMMDLLSTNLPGGDLLSCYDWRQQPLKLLQSETSDEPGSEAILHRVLAKGGSYESFDAYMECYVGLLREDCFAGMRKGLKALRCGNLDARDMRVFTGARLVAMSPPNVFGGAEGTVLELTARCETAAREMMFGSLVALAPRGSFETEGLVWATVAGCDVKKKELSIYVELGPTLNEENDAEVVSLLLRHSGSIVIAESPTFYRAYAPAIAALQAMTADDLPFADQIIHGRQEPTRLLYPGATIDASVVFSHADESEAAALAKMGMPEFTAHLHRLKSTDRKVAPNGVTTTLDRSQSEALHAAMTGRLTIIQGPPGTGKSYTIVRLLRLLDSISGREQDETGPTLVLTYKNRSLEDILGGCMQVWPEGVARCGGSARPGSLLEHRHIKSLLRSSKAKSPEVEEAKAKATQQRDRVQAAALALSAARRFSTATICAAEFEPQLRKLLRNAPATSEEEQSEFASLLSARGSSVDADEQLVSRVSGTVGLWLPNKKICASLCRASIADAGAQHLKEQSSPDGQRAEEEAADRSQYRSFEEATVRLEGADAPNSQHREVLELLNPLSDGDVHTLLQTDNPWDLAPSERVHLMHAMVRRTYMKAEQAYNDAMDTYNETLADLRRRDIEQQTALLSTMKVVGLTISGAAIYRDTIAALRAPHVLVEEAGEVLEPLTIAALGPWVQRLTVVGDHLQLPPSVENYELAKSFAFNTSLMERMVHNGLRNVTLSAQARMMPEMAQLLRDIYPSYRTSDRVDVANRCSPPSGALYSMWWWDVRASTDEGGESIDPAARSYINDSEATAAAALVKHLVRSGIDPSAITVLASYSAQIKLIEARTKKALSDVHESSWPVSHVHGFAARKLLLSLKEENPGPTGSKMREAHVQQSVHISETFLKLGEIDRARSALRHAEKLAEGAARAAIIEFGEQLEKLEETSSQVTEDCEFAENSEEAHEARGLLASAIDALKKMEELAVRFRTQGSAGIPMAAAACVLTQSLAKRIELTDLCSDGRKRLLHSMSLAAKKHLQELQTLDGVTFSSVDRYQGSENDVVIISLVRSNADGKVGFLAERARRVVAQSRARLGMYFVADRETFSCNSHWSHLIGEMCSCERLGAKIPLVCPAHKSRGPTVIPPGDASKVIECGICNEPCGQLMSCGVHRCKRRCHGSGSGIDELHMICNENVKDVCCAPEKHAITRKCYQQPADVGCLACEELKRTREEKERRDAEAREKQAQVELAKQIEELKAAPPGLASKDLTREGADVAEYLSVMDRTEKFVQADHDTPIQVLRIEKLYHPRLEERFHQAKLRLRSSLRECVTMDLFHGSSTEGVRGITENGFRLPEWSENNMFGQGVYFATDSSKSANKLYTKGSNMLILCDVLLGKSCTVDGLTSKHPLSKHVKSNAHARPPRPYLDVNLQKVRAAGFDSVCAPRGGSMHTGGVKYDEFIVYDVNQALPRYIVHFGMYAHALATPSLSGGSFQIRTVFPKRTFDPDDEMQMHFRVCESHLLRQLTAAGKKLSKIEVATSPPLMRQFEEQRTLFRESGIPSEIVLAFHATKTRETVNSIVKTNFDPDKIGSQTDAGWWGRGFYFSEFPATSMGYGNNMLLCKVLPGRAFDVSQRMDGQPLKSGFNSHRLHKNADGYGQELVIDNPKQILPCYILHFQ